MQQFPLGINRPDDGNLGNIKTPTARRAGKKWFKNPRQSETGVEEPLDVVQELFAAPASLYGITGLTKYWGTAV